MQSCEIDQSFTLLPAASFAARCNYRVNQSGDQRCRFPRSRCDGSARLHTYVSFSVSVFFHYSLYNLLRFHTPRACKLDRIIPERQCIATFLFLFSPPPSPLSLSLVFYIFTFDLSCMPRTAGIYTQRPGKRGTNSVFKAWTAGELYRIEFSSALTENIVDMCVRWVKHFRVFSNIVQ